MKNSYSGFAYFKISVNWCKSESLAMKAGDKIVIYDSANSRFLVSTTFFKFSKYFSKYGVIKFNCCLRYQKQLIFYLISFNASVEFASFISNHSYSFISAVGYNISHAFWTFLDSSLSSSFITIPFNSCFCSVVKSGDAKYTYNTECF